MVEGRAEASARLVTGHPLSSIEWRERSLPLTKDPRARAFRAERGTTRANDALGVDERDSRLDAEDGLVRRRAQVDDTVVEARVEPDDWPRSRALFLIRELVARRVCDLQRQVRQRLGDREDLAWARRAAKATSVSRPSGGRETKDHTPPQPARHDSGNQQHAGEEKARQLRLAPTESRFRFVCCTCYD